MRLLMSFFVGALAFIVGCGENADTQKSTTVHFYAEAEAPERLFDVKTGELNKAVVPTVLSNKPMRIKHKENYSSMTFSDFVDRDNAWFVVDGNYAAEFPGKHQFDYLSIADAYVNLAGVLRAQSISIGIDVFRFFIHPKRINIHGPASVVVSDSAVASTLMMSHKSFLTVTATGKLLISKKWQTASPQVIGITVQMPHIDIGNSFIKAPRIIVEKEGGLRIAKTSVTSFEVVVDGSIENRDTSNVYGMLNVSSLGHLLFEENTTFKPVPNQVRYQAVGIEVAELVVSETALVDGKISISSTWGPVDENEHFNQYKTFFAKDNEFVLVKAQKLLGRARLISQTDAQSEIPHLRKWHSYFEQFVKADNKKLALEHDYQRGLLKLKIVDKSVVTDKDGCLPDIGVFDRAEYNKHKRH